MVALREVDGMPHPAHPAQPQQPSWLVILETCPPGEGRFWLGGDCTINGVTLETGEAPVTVVTMDVSAEPGDGLDEQLVRRVAARARAEGLKLTGEGGLLARLTKVVVESALEGERDDHLGYGKHDPVGRNGGNSRHGTRPKTLVTEAGPVEVEVPRDRESSFEPVIVAKRQRRLSGIDDLVILLSARGLTHGEISAHLAEIYGV